MKESIFLDMMQLVRIAPTLTIIELGSLFWAQLKANEMLIPIRCHVLRFDVDQQQGHQS